MKTFIKLNKNTLSGVAGIAMTASMLGFVLWLMTRVCINWNYIGGIGL